jgi:hypothetical protein
LKFPQPKEQAIQAQILAYLRLKGYFVWKNSTVGIKKPDGSYIPSHAKGVSDILGLTKEGRFLAIEVKRPGGKLSPHQEAFLEAIRANKGIGLVAFSLSEVEKVL